MFSDPNELTVRLSDLDGEVVAIRKIDNGAEVRRTLPSGQVLKQRPILAEVLVYRSERGTQPHHITRETTLVFPESIKTVIEQAQQFVIGRLSLDVHPKNDEWGLWQLHKLDEEVRELVIPLFEEATEG